MPKYSFAIPVPQPHLRKLQDPTLPDVTRTVGYCEFAHLPFTIPMDPNPRKPTEKSLKSSLANDIRETAAEAMRLAAQKLPIPTKLVVRDSVGAH